MIEVEFPPGGLESVAGRSPQLQLDSSLQSAGLGALSLSLDCAPARDVLNRVRRQQPQLLTPPPPPPPPQKKKKRRRASDRLTRK